MLAYPLAYYLALSGTKRKYVLLLLLIAPFLTSYLLRVLAWKVILGDQGVINTFLFWTGLRSPDHPLSQLLYSRFAVMLVLGYIWLPFVALPIFVSLESLDRGLLEAASDLGASRLQAFRRVTLPLSLPGVFAAFLFVFIPTLGEFVTPSLVGGATGYMYGNQIVDLFGTGFPDWETGSVLAIFLLGVVAVLTLVFARFLQPTDARTDGRRALEERRVGAPGVLRPRRRLPLRADRDPRHLLVQHVGGARRFRSAGSRCHWYRAFLAQLRPEGRAADERDHRGALEHRSGAARRCWHRSPSSAGASGRRPPVSALLLSPLVIPYLVFGISLLLLFHTLGIPRSILTVVIGHIVITPPLHDARLMPRLQQIDVSLEEAAFDLGAGRVRTFCSITLPLILPAVVVGVPDRVHDLVRRVRGRVVRRRDPRDVPDLPLFGPSLPEPAAAGDRRRGRGDHDLAVRRRARRARPACDGTASRSVSRLIP